MTYYRITSTTLTWVAGPECEKDGSDTLPGLGHTSNSCWLDPPAVSFEGKSYTFYFTEKGWAEYQSTLASVTRRYLEDGDIPYVLTYETIMVKDLDVAWADEYQVCVLAR